MIRGPAKPKTKNDCAGKNQHKLPNQTKSKRVSCSVRVMRQKNMVTGPMGPETKNDSAGESQEKITRPDEVKVSWQQSNPPFIKEETTFQNM
jgi:hypothetical protein